MNVRCIVSVSGGKDSTAVCLYLRERGIPFTPIYMDVGWDNADTYRYLEDYLPTVIGPITVLRAEVPLVEGLEDETLAIEAKLGISPSPMVRLCVRKGMFPARTLRWCTEQLKAVPAIQHFKEVSASGDVVVNAIGVRREESAARSKVLEYEWSSAFNAIVWRPLAAWSVDEVIAIHQKHGIRPNGNYLKGALRVGCWPCIFARKSEIRAIADTDPVRIEVMRDLESLVGRRAQARREQAGKPPLSPPAWFQNPISEYVNGRKKGDLWPIDRVVEWSRTARGGRQFELFALPESESGCMRWGLCESGGTP